MLFITCHEICQSCRNMALTNQLPIQQTIISALLWHHLFEMPAWSCDAVSRKLYKAVSGQSVS